MGKKALDACEMPKILLTHPIHSLLNSQHLQVTFSTVCGSTASTDTPQGAVPASKPNAANMGFLQTLRQLTSAALHGSAAGTPGGCVLHDSPEEAAGQCEGAVCVGGAASHHVPPVCVTC